MAHFAELDDNNTVTRVVVVGNDVATEEVAILKDYLPQMVSLDEVKDFLKDKDLTLGGRLIGLAKKEFQKSAAKAAAWDVAKKEAAYGAAIGAGADMARQTAEIDADLMSDYNITRTLLAGTIGGEAQGTIGAGMGYWTGKRKAGKFYDKGDGFKGDYDLDYGVATPVNTKIKEPKKVTIKKTQKPVIEKKIKEFAEIVQEQSMKLGEKYKLIENEVRHQYTQSECGMYSLYVIVQLLKDIQFDKISTKKIPDKLMRDLRKKWFN